MHTDGGAAIVSTLTRANDDDARSAMLTEQVQAVTNPAATKTDYCERRSGRERRLSFRGGRRATDGATCLAIVLGFVAGPRKAEAAYTIHPASATLAVGQSITLIVA